MSNSLRLFVFLSLVYGTSDFNDSFIDRAICSLYLAVNLKLFTTIPTIFMLVFDPILSQSPSLLNNNSSYPYFRFIESFVEERLSLTTPRHLHAVSTLRLLEQHTSECERKESK